MDLSTHRRQLEQWRRQKELLEAELSRQIAEMGLEQQLRKANRRAVALTLPEGASLVEFVRFHVADFKAVPARGDQRWQPARYLAFVLCAERPDDVRMIDLGEADPIDRLIADFRGGITGEAETRAGRNMVARTTPPTALPAANVGPALRAAVFDPLIPALGGRTRLLLAPDGDLSRLPFEVLPDAGGRLLLDQYQISYVGCGRDVLRFKTPSSRPPAEPLVVADPHFDLAAEDAAPSAANESRSRRSRDFTRGDRRFDRLPGTREEGEHIGRLLGVKPWLHADALEARLKQRRSPRILHLATHGFFLADQERHPDKEFRDLGGMSGDPGRLSGPLPENPLLRLGLALAGANAWLERAVAAAGGRGRPANGRGRVRPGPTGHGTGRAVGVRDGAGRDPHRRGRLRSAPRLRLGRREGAGDESVEGARRRHARLLMEDFYRRLLAGEGKADALRNAQQTLREKPEFAAPVYWGAFICQGNPGPLAPAQPPRRRLRQQDVRAATVRERNEVLAPSPAPLRSRL